MKAASQVDSRRTSDRVSRLGFGPDPQWSLGSKDLSDGPSPP
jgi:hypothetical protein